MATLLADNSLKRGDLVRIQFGHSQVSGVITEERGPIGVGGRKLYTIEFEFGVDEPYRIELPAEKIEKIDA